MATERTSPGERGHASIWSRWATSATSVKDEAVGKKLNPFAYPEGCLV